MSPVVKSISKCTEALKKQIKAYDEVEAEFRRFSHLLQEWENMETTKLHKRGIYIRRIRPDDKSTSIFDAVKMVTYQRAGWECFGVFMHGRSRIALTVAKTKHECKRMFMGGWKKAKRFYKRNRKVQKIVIINGDDNKRRRYLKIAKKSV
jgi:hypothetical protein